MLIPAFQLQLNNSILKGLAVIGKCAWQWQWQCQCCALYCVATLRAHCMPCHAMVQCTCAVACKAVGGACCVW